MFLRGATKLGALAVWLGVGLCLVFWGLKLFVRPAALPPQASTVAPSQALRGDLTRLLGAAPEPVDDEPAPVAVASRFRLLGVVAPRAPRASAEGVALIAIDGKPARAYRVGAVVEGDLVLQQVRARGADLGARGAGSASVALDLAPLPPPATGVPGAQTYVAPPPRPPMARPVPPAIGNEGDTEGEPDDAPEPLPPNAVPLRQGQATQ